MKDQILKEINQKDLNHKHILAFLVFLFVLFFFYGRSVYNNVENNTNAISFFGKTAKDI